jgi:putative IMPACT (imprinted ancient) family translation regulator
LRVEFAELALVRARIRELDGYIEEETFVENGADMVVSAPQDRLDAIIGRIVDATRGRSIPRRIDS